jgi:hypothetical protein
MHLPLRGQEDSEPQSLALPHNSPRGSLGTQSNAIRVGDPDEIDPQKLWLHYHWAGVYKLSENV